MAAPTQEEDGASASAGEVKSALASALVEEEVESVQLKGGGGGDGDGDGDMGVLTLVRVRDQMKSQLMEYNTAVLASQEDFPDHVIEEKCIRRAIEVLQKEIEKVTVSFQNKTLALQRIQIMDALRNKVSHDDDEARLILETMKHIVLLSRTVVEYQQQARQKEQQLTDIKRKRLALKKDGRHKLQQIQTTMKRQKEEQASVNGTETEKLLVKLEGERRMATVIQHVFQNIITGSGVNWAEDPFLKAMVLKLGKKVS